MSDKKRLFMTDEERAQISRDHRLQQRRATTERASSEPAADAFAEEDHLTPITVVQERIEDELGRKLSEEGRAIVKALGRHDANQELRHRRRSDSQDTALLARRTDGVEDTLVEKFGKDGKGGEFASLLERVKTAESRRWWALTFVAGLLVTVITAAVAFGSWMGSIESDVETLKQRRSNRFPPEYPAAKDITP